MTTIRTIVEGHGEVHALPLLLRRIASMDERFDITFPTPHRCPKSRMVLPFIARVVELQFRQARNDGGGLLLLVDSDRDEPTELADRIRTHFPETALHIPVVVAVKEFEAWFLAGIESLSQHPDVTSNSPWSGNPEEVLGAKAALSSRMNVPYSETRHQPAFAALVDLDLAATRSPSLAQLIEAVRASYPVA